MRKSLFGGCHHHYYQASTSYQKEDGKKFNASTSSFTSHDKDSKSKTTIFFKFMFLVPM